MSTVLITNNLNVYKKVYKFLKVSTSLIANNLSVYTLDKKITLTLMEAPVAERKQRRSASGQQSILRRFGNRQKFNVVQQNAWR